MIIQRRAFLTGLAATLAAPAIVRAASLMPVKVMAQTIDGWTVRQLPMGLVNANGYEFTGYFASDGVVHIEDISHLTSVYDDGGGFLQLAFPARDNLLGVKMTYDDGVPGEALPGGWNTIWMPERAMTPDKQALVSLPPKVR